LQKLSVTKTLAGMSDFVYAVTFSPDGSMVAAGAYNGEVRIWNVNDGSERLAFNASPGYRVSSVTTNSKP
jgi:WD40 repeat protein